MQKGHIQHAVAVLFDYSASICVIERETLENFDVTDCKNLIKGLSNKGVGGSNRFPLEIITIQLRALLCWDNKIIPFIMTLSIKGSRAVISLEYVFLFIIPINICCICIASFIFVVIVEILWVALILPSELYMALLQVSYD